MTDMSDASQFLLPRGFRFGAAKAGLKASGHTDFALIVADAPASAAAVFTANRITAAPLIVDKEHMRATAGKVRVAAIMTPRTVVAAAPTVSTLDKILAIAVMIAALFAVGAVLYLMFGINIGS